MPDTPRVTAIVGATGVVGRELLAVLAERRFPVGDLRLLARARSAGDTLDFAGEPRRVQAAKPATLAGTDLVFLCAGSDVSRWLAPDLVREGATVIDSSSAYRADPDVPLVVPEVNGEVLDGFRGPGIVANPNCSTIVALVAVTPLHRVAPVRRMVVSTYQAVSGAGRAAMRGLEGQARRFAAGRPLTTGDTDRQYLFNVFSHDSPVGPDGANEEERKLARETRRIWGDDDVAVAATCVRVPVLRTHCESINLTFREPLGEADARTILERAPGVRVVDDRAANRFPEPRAATGRDEILVGRIRADDSQPPGLGLGLFVAGDQLRKGAALNAVQIAERLTPVPARQI
ncbi:MAG: aspartate-semialdehyde dehydrogenase [Planctomycetota bacterium]|jgi:aspartate-semialdehyde dehydrogenase